MSRDMKGFLILSGPPLFDSEVKEFKAVAKLKVVAAGISLYVVFEAIEMAVASRFLEPKGFRQMVAANG